jgi:hypothetical protein
LGDARKSPVSRPSTGATVARHLGRREADSAPLNDTRPGSPSRPRSQEPTMSLWRGSSHPIPHRGSHPTSGWLIRLERPPRADRSARGLGTCRRLGAHPQVGRSSRAAPPSGPAPGASPRGGERTPTRRAPGGVIAERQLPCRARVPPHATLPGRGAPCVQLSGDLRPGEALSSAR